MKEWHGAPPNNVRKDGKYRIVSGSDGYEIQVIYRINNREKALLATSDHEQLVDLVNDAKVELTGQKGGAFYINEYKDVLVPDPDGNGASHWIGTYERTLTFQLDPGRVISPKAPSGLKPGEPWPGPRVGTKYTLSADGKDLRFETRSGRIVKEVRLSDHVGASAAEALTRRIAAVKPGGGAVYVNECCEMFVPVGSTDTPDYIYVGSIDDDGWFSPPDGYDRP